MFQIGFWELMVVAVVSVWAFGPDKLPVVAKLATRWLGKLRQTYLDIKQEFDQHAQEVNSESSDKN